MSVLKQIGWNPEDYLLADISKQFDRLIQIASIIGGGTGTVTSINASGGTTGLTFSGGPVTTSGTLTLGGILSVANGGTGSSSGYTSSNGITKVVNDFQLGGAINNSTTLTVATGIPLTITVNTDFISDQFILQDLQNNQSVTFGLAGFSYRADYSGSYTVRSLIDKNYTDTHFKGLTFTNSPINGNVPTYNGTNWTFQAPISSYWSLVNGGTLTGANTITSNASNQLNFGGTFTETTGQYYLTFNPTITGPSGPSSRLATAVKIAPSFTAANGGPLVALDVSASYTPGAFTPSNISIRSGAGAMVLIGAATPTATANAATSTVLELQSSTQAFLPTRIASDASIANTLTGMLYYNTTANALHLFVGTNGSSSPWNTVMSPTTARLTAQTTNISIQSFNVGTSDASFIVSANIRPTTSTTHNFTVTCTYTDESNISRTVTMNFSEPNGTIVTAIANAAGTIPYEGIPLHIRCLASTTITIATIGTFTTVTYNAESQITQIS